jgi:hypothetical protein
MAHLIYLDQLTLQGGKTILNNCYCEGLNMLDAPYESDEVKLEVKGSAVVKGNMVCCDNLYINGYLKVFGNIYLTGKIFQGVSIDKPQNVSDAFYDA